MKRINIIGLALVAAFAISVVAVASASADPEWRKGGAGLGTTKVPLTTALNAGTPTLESVGKKVVTCTSVASNAELEKPNKVVNAVVTYKGCKSSGASCTTGTHTAGEVVTNTLSGEAKYLNTVHTKAGVLYKPPTSGEFAKFVCGLFVTVTVKGELLSEVEPLDTSGSGSQDNTTGKQTFAQAGGVQQWRAVEGKTENKHLESFGEESGVGGGAVLTSPLVETVTFQSAVELFKA
jgi:hypothetical protein